MKVLYRLSSILLITAAFLLLSGKSFAALNGTYTINTSLAASATNYQNFQSAISDLLSGTRSDGGVPNGVGVGSPVVFNVAAGVYTGQLTLSGNIVGASPVNTITFDGSDASTRIIEFNATVTGSRHTIKLENIKYVTFRNFTIKTLGNFGWAVHITGTTSAANSIKKCIVEMTGAGIAPLSATHVGIIANGSNTAPTTGARIDSLEIDSNTIINGYYGIALIGTPANAHQDNRVRQNNIMNSSSRATEVRAQNGIHIINNTIVPLAAVGAGIAMANSSSIAPKFTVISGNIITNFARFGIAIINSSNYGVKGHVYNNIISKGIGSGISLGGCEWWSVCHNSVNVNNGAPEDAALYIEEGAILTVYNNIFSVAQKSPMLPLYATDTLSFDSMDYNIFYRADISDGKFIYLNADYNTENFAGVSGYNTHSLFVKPTFVNDSNLLIANACFKGVLFSFANADFYGTARSAEPVIGAHEGTSLRNNLSLVKIAEPVNPYNMGWQDVRVIIHNIGDSIISSFDITYVHNGGYPVTQTWNGTLNPCDTVSVVFTGSNQVNLTQANLLTVYTSSPNGDTDPYRDNDTLNGSYHAPLNGNYTIGGSGSSFPTFNSAVESLKEAGVSGPVVFTVNPGTYNEQVSIDEEVVGASAINTITFDGVDAATRILDNANAIQTALHTFQIGSSHVRIRNLTIRASNANYAWGVYISRSNSKDIQVKKCVIDIVHAQPEESFAGIVFSGGAYLFSEILYRVDSIEIDSNIINNGMAGIWHIAYPDVNVLPSTHLYFRNNIINNTIYGIFVTNANGIVMHKNSISVSKENPGNGIIVETSDIPDSTYKFQITSNHIWNAYNGIDILYFNSEDSSYKALVANNTIHFTGNDGISLSSSSNMDIVHNSVNSAGLLLNPYASAALRTNDFDCFNLNISNNHFAVTREGSGTTTIYIENLAGLAYCDYNNYYKADTTQYIYLDGWYSKNSGYTGFSGLNNHSLAVNPEFTDDTLLTVKNACINGAADTTVITDLNNNIRNNPPDIGAYEVQQVSDDMAVVAVLSQSFPVDSGLQDLHVVVVNRGSNNVTSFNISYVLDNNMPVTQSWSAGVLAPCDTVSVVFSGIDQITISAGVTHVLKVYTSSPNGSIDSYTLNDTLERIVETPMSGTYTIGVAYNTDFVTLNDAVSALKRRGVSGAVNFSILSGIYNEQIMLNTVNGMSLVNTVSLSSAENHADSVSVIYSASAMDDNFVVKLLNASYYRFSNITFTAQNADYCKVFDIVLASSHNTIDNCKILGQQVTTTSLTGASVIYAGDFRGTHLSVTNNVIDGGSAGVHIVGQAALYSDSNCVLNNTISNFYIAGIYSYNTSNFRQNDNMISTNSTQAAPSAIYCFNANGALEILRNRITMNSNGYGLRVQSFTGNSTTKGIIANNVITVMGTADVYGIRNQASSWMRIYHNSVQVNSASVTSYAGYFYYNTVAHSNNDIKNNVLSNAGNGYAMHVYNPVLAANNKFDYNNLYTNGVNLVQRGTPVGTFQHINAWRSAVALDMNSISYQPGFISATDLQPNPMDSSSWSLNGRGIHLDSTIISTDINGNPRPTKREAGVPDIGAYEFTPTSIPPLATSLGSLAENTTQVFLFGGDTVAKINWTQFFNVPDKIEVRQYVGIPPTGVSETDQFMYFYIDIKDSGIKAYNYDIGIYYKDAWLGTISSEQNVRLFEYHNGWQWPNGVLSTDTSENKLNGQGLLLFSLFTGTDMTNPLPVQLLSFKANKVKDDVLLTWSTASEVNANSFLVERLVNGNQWSVIGKIEANGNSSSINNYQFTDQSPFTNHQSLYYRLRIVDNNGSYEYSKVVSVSQQPTTNNQQLSVYPNPFNNNVNVEFISENEGIVGINIVDLMGRDVQLNLSKQIVKGNNVLNIDTDKLNNGIYFLSVELNGEKQVVKLVKQ